MSKIEVRKDGRVYRVFDDEVEQLPDDKIIQSMKEAGYRLYKDGKLYRRGSKKKEIEYGTN